MDWDRKWLVNFKAGAIDHSNNCGAIDMKMNGSVHDEKSVFKDAGIDSLLNWIGTLTLSIATASQKIVLRFDVSMKTFFKVTLYLCKCKLQPCMVHCCHVWPLLLITSRTCWISYQNRYVAMQVLQLLLLLKPWLINEK